MTFRWIFIHLELYFCDVYKRHTVDGIVLDWLRFIVSLYKVACKRGVGDIFFIVCDAILLSIWLQSEPEFDLHENDLLVRICRFSSHFCLEKQSSGMWRICDKQFCTFKQERVRNLDELASVGVEA